MTLGREVRSVGSVAVVIATYCEADNIKEVLSEVLTVDERLQVVVVDDDGGDGTADIAAAMGEKTGRVAVIRRPRKAGLASAYRDGFRWALERQIDVVVGMDADLSHDPRAIPTLLRAVETGADVSVGSRYVPGGETVGWPLFRRVLSRVGNWYASRALGVDATDLTSAFRAYRSEVLRRVDLDQLRADGYGFLMELLFLLETSGAVREDIPITFVDRQHGKSKMSTAIAVESLAVVTRIGVRQRLSTRRR